MIVHCTIISLYIHTHIYKDIYTSDIWNTIIDICEIYTAAIQYICDIYILVSHLILYTAQSIIITYVGYTTPSFHPDLHQILTSCQNDAIM